MRLFPSGVSVVTADAEGDRIGVTIGSLVSLSLEPPLVGISVGKDNALHELLRSAGAFGVSLLRGDQAELAAHFARGVPPIALAGARSRCANRRQARRSSQTRSDGSSAAFGPSTTSATTRCSLEK